MPNDKILDWSKLKASAEEKSNMKEKLDICFATVTIIFSFFHNVCKGSLYRVVKSHDCVVKG